MTQAGTTEHEDESVGGAARTDNRRNFYWYWVSTAVSGTGTAVSGLVIPLMAVTILRASTAQMSVLAAVGIVPSILFQVLVATWADAASSRVRIMVIADLLSGLLVGLIPLLWWDGVLTMDFLLAVMVAKAVVGVSQQAFAAPVAVDVVPRDDLVRANGRLNGTRSATDIAGQGVGGALLAIVSAPFALIVDAVSFFASALFASRIRLTQNPRDTATTDSDGDPTASPASSPGIRTIARDLARQIHVWCLMAIALANGITESVFVLFCVHSLHVRSSALGFLLALGAVGGVMGGFSVGFVAQRFGRWSIVLGSVATIWSLFPLLLASQGVTAMAAIVNFELAGAFGGTIVIAVVFGELQAQAAQAGTVSRTMAMASNSLQTAALLGVVLGGLVGGLASARWALGTGTALLVLISAPLVIVLTRKSNVGDPSTGVFGAP